MAQASGNRARVLAASKAVRNEIARSREQLGAIKWVLREVVPLLPAGVSVPSQSWDYERGQVLLLIQPDENRQWRGLDGTAVMIYRIRKAFGVEAFKRELDGYSETDYTTSFTGRGTVGDQSVYVRVRLPNQKPDTCAIVIDEVLDNTPRIVKKFRTVCN